MLESVISDEIHNKLMMLAVILFYQYRSWSDARESSSIVLLCRQFRLNASRSTVKKWKTFVFLLYHFFDDRVALQYVSKEQEKHLQTRLVLFFYERFIMTCLIERDIRLRITAVKYFYTKFRYEYWRKSYSGPQNNQPEWDDLLMCRFILYLKNNLHDNKAMPIIKLIVNWLVELIRQEQPLVLWTNVLLDVW
jgi:hypothetical protein